MEKREMQLEGITRQRQHVPELPSAQVPKGHACFFPFGLSEATFALLAADTDGSGFARTFSVCAFLNLRNASRYSGCFTPKIAVASNAALIAPAFPIAIVPTGIPPGICAMESRESSPFKAFDSIGTRRMGSIVFAAAIPGKCGAPPAPAIITCKPRCSAFDAYSKSKSGVRCAETTRVSYRTPSSPSVFAACSMVSQSELEPMITPTNTPSFFAEDLFDSLLICPAFSHKAE